MNIRVLAFLLLLLFHNFCFAGMCHELAYGGVKGQMNRLDGVPNNSSEKLLLLEDVAQQIRNMLKACYTEIDDNQKYNSDTRSVLLYKLNDSYARLAELINISEQYRKKVSELTNETLNDFSKDNIFTGILKYAAVGSVADQTYSKALNEKHNQAIDSLNELIRKIKSVE